MQKPENIDYYIISVSNRLNDFYYYIEERKYFNIFRFRICYTSNYITEYKKDLLNLCYNVIPKKFLYYHYAEKEIQKLISENENRYVVYINQKLKNEEIIYDKCKYIRKYI